VILISNTTPIINFAAINKLELLRELYGRVLIPNAVYYELVIKAALPGAYEVQSLAWIETRLVLDRARVADLQTRMDPGEAEAIALAIEADNSLLVLDDYKARKEAQGIGLRVTGSLGILIEAKRQGLIDTVKPTLDDMIAQATFWVGHDLYLQVLRQAGEE